MLQKWKAVQAFTCVDHMEGLQTGNAPTGEEQVSDRSGLADPPSF